MTVYNLSFDGVPMPRPKREGVIITDEKIWSANTGRTSSGKMVGTVIAVKTTVQIDWGPLTPSEAALIRRAVSRKEKPFQTITFTDVDGTVTTKTVYFGTPSFTIRKTGTNSRITGATVSGIEQ